MLQRRFAKIKPALVPPTVIGNITLCRPIHIGNYMNASAIKGSFSTSVLCGRVLLFSSEELDLSWG